MTSLRIEDLDDRLVVRLDRPRERNAITQEVVDELHDVCGALEREPRVPLLTGGDEGVFAGGADIGQLRERGRLDALAGINLQLFRRILALPMPTVAAVDGWALGGGAELAYACDLRIASERAVFGQPEVELGIIAGAGATWRLPRLVGESVAKQMLLAGRRLDAQEALRVGLVVDVVAPEDLLQAAGRLVDRVLKGSPLALRLTKLAVDAPEGAHPAVDLTAQAVLFEDEEKRKRMTAFLERRTRGK